MLRSRSIGYLDLGCNLKDSPEGSMITTKTPLPLFLAVVVFQGCMHIGLERTVTTSGELHNVFLKPHDSLVIRLSPGTYHLSPSVVIDSTCGNCADPHTLVRVTVGMTISGQRVRIVGPPDRSAIIYTHAGYGLFFKDCKDCSVENLTITGGARDTNGQAADAAIVVKNSSLAIKNNRIVDNIGDSATVSRNVVGIMGIAGREGASISITDNEIIRNSWDGIALYRDARAHIEGNVIDGVDKATGSRIGGGRGVAIGVTWNGQATIKGNLVKRYWKGIGLFVDADGIVENNIVEDIVTWGISLWDAGKGKPVGKIAGNIVYGTGACGASITRGSEEGNPGYFRGNILTGTGQNPKYDSPDYYCYQCALALHAVPKNFVIEQNVFYNNRRATSDLHDYDVTREEFLAAIQGRCGELRVNALLRRADFMKEFCGE